MEPSSRPLPPSLPAAPSRRAAQQDWYRVAGVTLAWVALVGVALAMASSFTLLPDWVSRLGLTVAGLALAVHVGMSVLLSRTPRLEA